MPITPIRPSTLPPSVTGGPPALVAHGTRFVTINGQVSRDAEGRLVNGRDPVTQADQTWRNVRHALTGAGVTGLDVIQFRISVVGLASWHPDPILAAGREVFGDEWMVQATGSLVGVVSLGRADLLIEIEALAIA